VTTDAQILSALRAAGEGGVSGVELSQTLGITRAAIWARIEELRELGYDIEASPHLGYRLLSAPDLLHADDLIARLHQEADDSKTDARWGDPAPAGEPQSLANKRLAGTLAPPGQHIIGRDIRVFQGTTSTSDVVEKLARDDVREGFVVFAESQTKGRGRLGRKWISPARKGLWFSVLLRPDLRPQEITQLTVASATALVRAIQAQTGIKLEIKWPNDILIRGRKTAGILTELSAELDHTKYVILGIGVDVNQTAKDFPTELRRLATSIRIETGQIVDRAELATQILRELDRDYRRVCAGDFESVANEWEQHCTTLGCDVVIQIGERKVHGRAESLDPDGALLLRTQHGHLERIIGGDVTVEK